MDTALQLCPVAWVVVPSAAGGVFTAGSSCAGWLLHPVAVLWARWYCLSSLVFGWLCCGPAVLPRLRVAVLWARWYCLLSVLPRLRVAVLWARWYCLSSLVFGWLCCGPAGIVCPPSSSGGCAVGPLVLSVLPRLRVAVLWARWYCLSSSSGGCAVGPLVLSVLVFGWLCCGPAGIVCPRLRVAVYE